MLLTLMFWGLAMEAMTTERLPLRALDKVRTFGGQFAQANQTFVRGSETFFDQQRSRLIKTSGIGISLSSSTLSNEVIYLDAPLENSGGLSYPGAKIMVKELPRIEGIRWVIPHLPTIMRILANHQEVTGHPLLGKQGVWTSEIYTHAPNRAEARVTVSGHEDGGVELGYQRLQDTSENISVCAIAIPDRPCFWPQCLPWPITELEPGRSAA